MLTAANTIKGTAGPVCLPCKTRLNYWRSNGRSNGRSEAAPSYQIGNDGGQNPSDATEGGAEAHSGASAVGWEQFRRVRINAAQNVRSEELAEEGTNHLVNGRI